MIIAGIAATSVNATICATPAARSTEGFFEAKQLIETTQKACEAKEADNIVVTGLPLSIIAELNNAFQSSDTYSIANVGANFNLNTREGTLFVECTEGVTLPPGTEFSQLLHRVTQGRG